MSDSIPPAVRLDALYTALAEAIGRVGEDNAALLLATLSLDLLARHVDDDARHDAAMAAIARAESLTVA